MKRREGINHWNELEKMKELERNINWIKDDSRTFPSRKYNRKECNLLILKELEKFFTENPDIRFFQGLQILKLQEIKRRERDFDNFAFNYIPDNFHEESEETFKKLKK